MAKYQDWLAEDGLLRLEAWARDGLTDEQIAHNCGISVATLYRWKDKYCKICEALKRGKDVADIEVENALNKRALGYQYTEIKIKQTPDGKEITKTIKEVAPDVGAAIFWLKNRKPDVWRDKPTTETDEVLKKLDTILGGIDDIADR